MDYAAIDKRRANYSDDVYFLNYDSDFELWLNGKKVESFINLGQVNKYLFDRYVAARPMRRVYVYTRYFDEVYRIYERNSEKVAFRVINKKNKIEPKAFRIFGGITYKEAKYYLGTDKAESTKDYCDLIKRFHNGSNIKNNFTTALKNMILNEDLQDFGRPENLPLAVIEELYHNASLAPIIYSEINKEFKGVHCYDFDSAYISKYYKHKFPYKFTYAGTSVGGGKEHFVRLRIKNIRAKNPRFLPLSVADKHNGKGMKCISIDSKRILMADEVVISLFYNLEFNLLNLYYDYDSIEIEASYEVEMKQLPPSFLREVMDIYKTKSEAKHRGEPYADKKVLLNRIHGFFLTKKSFGNKEVQMYPNLPVQIGFYTIALQRVAMCNLINNVGLENIVSAHTDSIKTKGNFDAIIDELNKGYKTPFSDTLGILEKEGVMEKVTYFSNTRAKYIQDGVFKIKHGGIDDKTTKDILAEYTYDTLTKESPYNHTILTTFESEGEENILSRKVQRRTFSEGGIFNEE